MQKILNTNRMKKLFLLAMAATAILFTSCQKEFTVTVMSDDAGKGITSGSGTYFKGTEIEIAAQPLSGYKFLKWNDENTNNPRRITVTKNETFTAVFDQASNASLVIDGVVKTIDSVKLDKSDFTGSDRYDIRIFLPDFETIQIMADLENHEGRVLDLTKKEAAHRGWCWVVKYSTANNGIIFDTYGSPEDNYPVFSSGTMYIELITINGSGKPKFEIRINNGRVKAEGVYGDGEYHTIELYYKGVLGFGEYL